MTLLQNMVQMLCVYMKCLWGHLKPKPWQTNGVKGMRPLQRVWHSIDVDKDALQANIKDDAEVDI